jgi:hypothetical protein
MVRQGQFLFELALATCLIRPSSCYLTGPIPKIAHQEVRTIAREYAKHITSYPLSRTDDIPTLFHGFTILNVFHKDTPGEFKRTTYGQIVAERLA